MPVPEHPIPQLPADESGVFDPPQSNQSTRQPRGEIITWLNQARAPKLLDQVRLSIRARHYSKRTEESYVHWIRRFIFFHNKRHPSEMGQQEINAYLTHLALKEHVSSSTQNQALSALLFLYRYVLGRNLGELGDVIRARRRKRLPVVLTREEVKAVLAQLHGDKWLMASLIYGAGLRLTECLRLRVQDVDFARNEILVRDGKGGKDRVTMLAKSLKKRLEEHLHRMKAVHEKDLAEGWGRVPLPDAPACCRQAGQKVSECLSGVALAMGISTRASVEERKDRRARSASRGRVHPAEGVQASSSKGRIDEKGHVSYTQALVCNSPDTGWI